MRGSVLCSTLLLLTLAAPGSAQYPPDVAVGTRVRLVVRDSLRQAPLVPRQQMLFGSVTGIDGDTLYVAVPNTSGSVGVPRSSLRQLSVSRGVPSRFESALRHGVTGAATLALGFWIEHSFDDEPHFESGGEAALIGAGIGFGVGALLGALSPSERWRRIRLR